MPDSTDVIQGTLDMPILKSLSLEPMHGFGVTKRIEQISQGVFRVNPGSLLLAVRGGVVGYGSLYSIASRSAMSADRDHHELVRPDDSFGSAITFCARHGRPRAGEPSAE